MATEGKKTKSSANLPNLYQLLGLEPLESDRNRIEAALRQIVAKAKAAGASDSKQAQRLSKILELGKFHLLSAERKRAYDAGWNSVYQAQDQAKQTRRSIEDAADWDYRELDTLLPSGDPRQVFDLGQFLEVAATLPESRLEADFQKLESLLSGNEIPVAELPKQTTQSVAVTAEMLQSPVSQVTNLAVGGTATSSPPRPATAKRSKGKNLAKELRRKRDRSLLLSIAGVLVSLVVVLGVLFVVLGRDEEPETQTQPVAMNPTVVPSRGGGGVPTNPSAPRGSGLPKVAGLENLNGMELTGGPQAVDADPEIDPSDSSALVMDEPPASTMEPVPPMAEPTSEPEPVAAAEPKPEPQLSDADKATWKQRLTAIRELIAQQEFENARQQLVEAEPLAKTSQQKSQYGRLGLLLNLASEFHAALLEAIESLGPGETFKVKSTDVSFVEGGPEKISIRMRGTNQSYALTQIPVGLAFGLVDLKLDVLHGSTLARKAAFAIVHPKSNDLALKQARAWMSEAIETGFAPSDMAEIFNDDYQL